MCETKDANSSNTMNTFSTNEEALSKEIFDISGYSEKLNEYHSELYGFEERLYYLWYKPFSLYEYFTIQTQEVNKKYKDAYGQIAAEEDDLVFSVVLRLHAKSCIVAKEVLALMRSGYPDGASARCRTLNEFVIISYFIAKHGNEVAKRYVDHRNIETCKAAEEFQKYCKKIGEIPLADEEMEKHRKKRQDLIDLYKSPFKEMHGWAADALNNPKPSLSDLMRNVGFSHLLPSNRMASWAIHASNAKCLLFTLSSPDEGCILTGESNYGMADPGCSATLSLWQINHLLITLRENRNNQTIIESMTSLTNEIRKTFVEVHNSIDTSIVKMS